MPQEKLLDVLTKRETAPRSRTHEDPTIAKALEFLQQDLNPIQVIGLPEARDIYHKLGVGGPSKTMSMFRAPGDKTDPNIYVNSEGYSYNEARKAKKLNDFRNVRLASQLLHEQVHNTDDERAARRKEADYIRWQLEELKKIPPSQREAAREHLRVVESIANRQPSANEKFESDFQKWYKARASKLGLDPDPDSPLHYYDYRAAYRAKAEPDSEGHWPSEFKRVGHPNLVVNGLDTRTGKPVKK